jgi:lipoprotein-anchoring transpeptidase ErfK/SrfK
MKSLCTARIVRSLLAITLVSALTFTSVTTAQAVEASSAVREAQTILTKFGIPTGTIDGYYGPNTARGLCAFRQVSGAAWSRKNVNATLLSKLRSYNSTYSNLGAVPAPSKNGHNTYILVNQTCQTLTYVENGHYSRIMTTSTGMSGHRTANGTYSMGQTQRGWHCSTSYPESCATHTQGRFASIASFGNMYNRRAVYGSVFVHGSTSVPTTPASHGCIRVTVTNSDWMYDHVGNNGSVYMVIAGAY